MTAVSLPAQTFKSLASFDFTDGAGPQAGLVQATNGDLYGTTGGGGLNSSGTIFKMTPRGVLTTVYNFCSLANCADGSNPLAGLVQATNGYLYGTTQQGGMYGSGTVFKITPSGSLTTLYSFCSPGCTDGANPSAGLIQASNGDLYGTTAGGGSGIGAGGSGTIFKITPSGTLTTVYRFCSQTNCTDGSAPHAGLIQATNGDFYGTTTAGGAHGEGTVFKLTPSGTLTTLHSFCSRKGCADGSNPESALVQATNGDFYGTTTFGGGINNLGTVFEITSGGKLTTLYSFCAQTPCTDGYNPVAGLIQATDGNLYGTVPSGGDPMTEGGTIYKITTGGSFGTIYSFTTEGEQPTATLVQDTNGELYGTTSLGGTSTACQNGCGTVFSLSVGLNPFITTLPVAGLVAEAVKILGSDLTGATSVTFNGTAAAFTVVSSAQITTTVPIGATTGMIQVVIPSGTLSSNVSFQVLP
ncbi:MAG: choice-of-anchor tandem repeat GloVer-containing protein [Bryobacteraceae bacterium]